MLLTVLYVSDLCPLVPEIVRTVYEEHMQKPAEAGFGVVYIKYILLKGFSEVHVEYKILRFNRGFPCQ